MEREPALGPVLELDFGEGMTRRVAGLAFAIEFGAVGRRVAGRTDRFGFLLATVAGITGQFGMAAF